MLTDLKTLDECSELIETIKKRLCNMEDLPSRKPSSEIEELSFTIKDLLEEIKVARIKRSLENIKQEGEKILQLLEEE